METYHFITIWKIEAPLSSVWDAIFKSEEWPQWWKYVKKVTLIEKGDANDIGTVRQFDWSTKFFYTISFKSKLVENGYGKRLKGQAWGELNGEGLWTFSEENGITTATYYWDVQTSKGWMNLFSPILKPLFKYNHDVVMQAGADGLSKKLNAKLIAS